MLLRTISRRLYKSSPMLLQSRRATFHRRPPIVNDEWRVTLLALGSFAGAITGACAIDSFHSKSRCEEVITVASLPPLVEDEDKELESSLPTYTSAEVSMHNGKASKRVWMSYGGYVYDATEFIANHPGGAEKIMLAAGGPIEPYWHLYRQHFASDLPLRLMEEMIIGKLNPDDQDVIDDDLEKVVEADGDPYEHEPERHPLLIVHSDTPMNAEVPVDIITKQYLTPPNLFYIRNHHPVPLLSEDDIKDFRLEIDLSVFGDKEESVAKLSLEQIKALPKVDIVSTLQCSGNRRSGFNDLRQTSGTNWGQGAISTTRWSGVRLTDLLQFATEHVAMDASPDEKEMKLSKSTGDSLLKTLQNLQSILERHTDVQHLRMKSLDGMEASIPILKALSPFGDVILAYEMDGKPLTRDHGYPLRLIVPGYAAVRQVKWLSKLAFHLEEAEGPWQRGLNYKIIPPSQMDASAVALNEMPRLTEEPVISGITNLEKVRGTQGLNVKPGDTIMVNASGWAWAGGGRNIVRVDVTGDDGKTWETAKITQGGDQPFGRAWAWVFWECDVPAKVLEDGQSVEVSCKGVDIAFNTQPQYVDGMWNVRGLANNAWYRSRLSV